MGLEMITGVILSLLLTQAHAGDAKSNEHDELAMKKQQLVAINNAADEINNEIEELNRVSADRQRRIQELNAQIKQAKRNLSQRQAEAAQVKTDASAIEQQLAHVQNEFAIIDDQDKVELARIEAERQVELTKKAELMAQLALLQQKRKVSVKTRKVAQQHVQEIQRDNARLYDKLKGKGGTKIINVGDQ